MIILPCPVRATNSAAPLNGFVTIPTSPRPTPVTKDLGEAPSDMTDCRGWCAIPPTAPRRLIPSPVKPYKTKMNLNFYIFLKYFRK